MGVERRMRIVHGRGSVAAERAVKVAFATSDMQHVDQHFGAARGFALYAVDPERSVLLEVARFGKQVRDGNEDKLAEKIAMLEGCAVVFCRAIGASAVRQLLACGVQPVKVGEGADVKELLESLRRQLREGPSVWLARAMQHRGARDMDRFDAMESEGWEE